MKIKTAENRVTCYPQTKKKERKKKKSQLNSQDERTLKNFNPQNINIDSNKAFINESVCFYNKFHWSK